MVSEGLPCNALYPCLHRGAQGLSSVSMEGLSPVMDGAQRRIKVLRHQLASCSQIANVVGEPTTQLCKAHDASEAGLKSQGTPIIIGGMLLDIQVICHINIILYLVRVGGKACAHADHRHRSATARE